MLVSRCSLVDRVFIAVGTCCVVSIGVLAAGQFTAIDRVFIDTGGTCFVVSFWDVGKQDSSLQ